MRRACVRQLNAPSQTDQAERKSRSPGGSQRHRQWIRVQLTRRKTGAIYANCKVLVSTDDTDPTVTRDVSNICRHLSTFRRVKAHYAELQHHLSRTRIKILYPTGGTLLVWATGVKLRCTSSICPKKSQSTTDTNVAPAVSFADAAA